MFTLPFFLVLVKHYSPQQTGLLVAVIPGLSVLMAPVAGSLSDRFGERSINIIGLVLLVFGCLAISTFDAELTIPGYLLRVTPLAFGVAMFQPPNQSAVKGHVPPEQLGLASGLLLLSRTLGHTIGLSLIGIGIGVLLSILTNSHTDAQFQIDITDAPVEAIVFGEQMSFRLVALILIAALILAIWLWRLEQRRESVLGESTQAANI